MSQNPSRINAPLNFRTSDTLITTKVPHYPTKVDTGTQIVPGWNRPNANGLNSNIISSDYNGPNFKARPLKQWRRQLRVYNNNGNSTSNNSRTAIISQLERPGVAVYHYDPVCTCVGNEGGNSYIIANNKFGYETKGNQFSEPQNDVQIQNNGFNTVPYDATEQMIKDPTNPAYEVLTGVSNTNCINCSPQNNIIKRSIAFNSQAYFADSYAKQQSRCQTYEQNISTNRVNVIQYSNNNQPLWPSNSPLGSQVVAPVNYTPPRLYAKPCLSQTIYKPNNVAFAKQGAVPGSTRLKKLVADTVTLNGNSFYSAAAATAANFGKYQGTNIPGNYYVKIKQVVDSCIGTVPNPPILIFVNNTLTSITVSWNTPINNSCPILFYTLTFYPVLSNTPISIIVYPSNNNNNIYTIAGLSSNTYYEISITATNGNGTSDINNILSSNTLFDYQIQILLSPSTYTYTYSPSSINVTVTVTSLNPNTPIVLSLINMQDLSGNVINNVAVLTPTSTNNVYSLVLNNAGSFNVYAQQAGSGIYQNSTATSPTITINRFPTTINFNSPIPTSGTFGSPYNLPSPLITWVTPISQPAELTVTYSTSNPAFATFTSSIDPTSFTINNAGTFTITASTNLTQNYESTSITTSAINISKGTITLSFQTPFITPTQFGSPYTIPSIIATNQESTTVTGLTITYSTSDSNVATFTNPNDPSTFKILNAGTFTVSAYSNATDQYNASNISSPTITATNVPELIIYNNPRVFPRSGGTSGEVGIVIGIPSGTWPMGFSDFTSVDISRAGATITLNSGTTPTYIFSLNKYLVYGEPGTSGPFIGALSTGTAANIAFAGTNTIANGATSGVTIQFVFQGGSGSGVPSTYTLNVSTGSIDISQGLLFSTYPSITSSTINPPPSGQSQVGSMTVGWKGFDSNNTITSTIQQAWGISADSSSSTYPTYSPLIASGSPPNHTFYPTTNIGTTYYYYIGIPKMITPNY
jgi:hypothetical protein